MKLKQLILATAISSLFASSAFATNGYAPHGIGQKAKGMGGAGVAYSKDTLAGGVNPAGMVHQGNRMDAGAEIFKPDRETNTMAAPTTSYSANETSMFLVPEFGYNRMSDNDTSFGVSVFGNGGMNTDYDNLPGVGDGGQTGINLMQLFIVPSWSHKLNDNNSVGIGLNLAYQTIAIRGLSNFAGMSSDATKLTNNGTDSSSGIGLRLGWIGNISDTVTLGATYQTRTDMSEFDKYSGLFAEQGDFDIPENYAVGIAVAATPKLNIAFDIMRINYSSVKAISTLNPGGALGTDGGTGFGWGDQTVYKLGFDYAYEDDLTLRAGFNIGDTPLKSSQTTFNTLAPATVEKHLTLGATWQLKDDHELTISYMHAFENEVKGNGTASGGYDLRMEQNSIGVAYSWKM